MLQIADKPSSVVRCADCGIKSCRRWSVHLSQMAWMHLIASTELIDGKVWKRMEHSANSGGDILLMLH